MDALAILVSGGLDSAILLGDALRQGSTVYPIYVRCGLFWEAVEVEYLGRYLTAIHAPLAAVDGSHATRRRSLWPTLERHRPKRSGCVIGRRCGLLAGPQSAFAHQIAALVPSPWNRVFGTWIIRLQPFPRRQPDFFRDLANLVDQSVGDKVRVLLPFADMNKRDVMKLGTGLPLEHSFSCIQPIDGRHCGKCNKCAERRLAFISAHMIDPTEYENGYPRALGEREREPRDS